MNKQITSLKAFFHEITFPGRKQVRKNTTDVLLTGLIIGAFICIADFIAVTGVEMLLSVF